MSEQVNISTLIRRVEGLSDAAAEMAKAVRDSGSLETADMALNEHENRPDAHAIAIAEAVAGHNAAPDANPAAFEKHNADLNAHVALLAARTRRRLAENTTFYVRADGNDSNDGLSAVSAFLTFARMLDELRRIDGCGFDVAVNIGAGTWNEPLSILSGLSGIGMLSLNGSGIDSSIVSVNGTTGASAVDVSGNNGVRYFFVLNLSLQNSRNGVGFANGASGFVKNLDFNGNYSNIVVDSHSGIYSDGPMRISGPSNCHMSVSYNSKLHFNGRLAPHTLLNSPDFTSAFAVVYGASVLDAPGINFTGTATGKRYDVTRLSVINTGSAGPNYFPGSIAGTVDASSYII